MQIFRERIAVSAYINDLQQRRLKVGFVPTMGALHPGHLALLKKARSENDVLVASIFVNPTQFDDPDDFKNYPETIEQDKKLLEDVNCDILFMPDTNEMYPEGLKIDAPFDPGYLAEILEGKQRSGHFEGVITVVNKLFNAIHPDNAYFGQKDYQQYLVIREMSNNLHPDINIKMVPTERENEGLAMSSRNVRLTDENKKKAYKIFEALQRVLSEKKTKQPPEIENELTNFLEEKGLSVEYFVVRNAETLMPVEKWSDAETFVVCAAAKAGSVRLIDNILIEK